MMRKKMTGKAVALLLAMVMIVSLLPTTVFAAETDEFTVVVSMEGLTLGQGLYVEPKAYTLDEINTLIATEGYGPYTEDTLTASMATLAMMIDHGLEYENTGAWDSSMYLSAVKDLDTGVVDIPAVITENGGPSNEDNDGNADEYLGEFDYSSMSGWMITVNDFMIDVGCADWVFADGVTNGKCGDYGNLYVVRWQFTLHGYGADLGFSTGWGNDAYFDHVNKDMMYAAYALSDDSGAKASVMPTMKNLTATAAEVAAAEAALAPQSEPDQPEAGQSQDVSTVLNDTMAQLAATIPEPVFGSTGGEWTVLCLARGGYYEKDNAYFTSYYDRIVEYVNETAASVSLANGALHKNKSTDNSRLILALSSIGKDATSVGDWNLITPYEDFSWIKKQGINGPIFALIALDTHGYQTTDTTIRQQCIDYILSKELEGGGWALSGTAADPDITAMALQALVNYKDQAAVSAAAEAAFAWLASAQNEKGGYSSWGTENSESIAQVITACAAWGINPDTDSRFVKNGNSAVDAILTFYDSSAKAFKHVADGSADAMATDQACYALIAYDRFLNGKTALYDMSDVTFETSETPETPDDTIRAILGLPAKVEAAEDAAFNATVSLTNWNNEAGYKLIDLIVTVPEGLRVTGVTPGSRLSGGELSYNLEADTGKLRIVYFDANENSNLTISGTEYPAEVLTIGFALENVAAGSTLPIAISGMSIKLFSDSTDENAMIIVDTADASGSVEVVQGISFSAVTLYTGDDVDLIPSTKKAVAVSVTGISKGAKIQYNDGTNEISFLLSVEMSHDIGVSTYVALVDASIEMSEFVDASNYTIPGGKSDRIDFGDINLDGEINAQDALAAVDFWLRKGEEPTDLQILTSNVNGDSRINTFDALGIVEAFVDGADYGVVTKAATLFGKS